MSTAAAATAPAADAAPPRAGGGAAANRGLPRGVALLIGLGCLPLPGLALVMSWSHPGYQFLTVGWLAAGWLMRRNWRELPEDLVPGTRVGSAILLGMAGFLAGLSTLLWSPWGGVLSAGLAVVGLAWWAGAWPAVRALLPGLVLALLCTPPPLGLDEMALDWLGVKTVSVASRLLMAMSVPHFVSLLSLEAPGLVLPLPSVRGLAHALPAVVAWAWGCAVWWRRPVWRGVLGVGAGAAFAVLAAVAATVFAVQGSVGARVDLFAGARGWLLVGGVAVVAGLLVASFDQLLQFVVAPVMVPEASPELGRTRMGAGPRLWQREAPRGMGRWGAWAFALLGLAQLPLTGLFLWHEFSEPSPLVSRLPASLIFQAPEPPQGWTQVAAPPPFFPPVPTNAATREIWYFARGDCYAAVTAEYPVRSTADFTQVFENADWRVVESRTRGGGPAEPPVWTYGLMQKGWLQVCGYWVGVLEENGRWTRAPVSRFSLLAPFRPRIQGAPALRVVAIAVGREPLDDTQREASGELFQALRAELGRQFTAGMRPR